MSCVLSDKPQHFRDFLPLFNEVDYYHNTTRGGFFSILAKKGDVIRQRSYRLDLLPQIQNMIDSTEDIYISQGEFFKPNRRLVNLARIGLCFVDIDYYATEWREHSAEHLVGAILLHCNDNGIPEPSAVISSGRGLYLKWYLAESIPRQALPRWNAVQTELVAKFTHFGSDPRAKDASRVLRLVDTTNTKSGRIVETIWQNSNLLYDFESLCQEVLPADRHEVRQNEIACQSQIQARRDRLKVTSSGNNPHPGLRPLSGTQLNWDRLEDLRCLARLRGGVQPGQRDTFLFLSTCFCAWTITPCQLYNETAALAREFAPELSPGNIHSYTSTTVKRAEAAAKGELVMYQGQQVDSRYRFRNQTLIDWLQIIPEEEHQLKTIISKTEAAERHRQRNRKYSDRKTYLCAAEDRKASAKLLAAQGKTPFQIAEALAISRRSVFNYLSN